jgi:hypothetical protein
VGKEWPPRKADNFPPPVSLCSRENMGFSMSHNPMGLHGPEIALSSLRYLYYFPFLITTFLPCQKEDYKNHITESATNEYLFARQFHTSVNFYS